ncbi:MAG: 30S ribosomal protein S9 [Flavobacteriales bacterium]|jgi:small subunit ribosomal protein S9|nr:30S ribosomal protein S9 [Flavobacteriales bacterium]|tara:strand:+ start:867 stop:1253 length:387 start_codon:yes stop_codon:yes gene_type:complete
MEVTHSIGRRKKSVARIYMKSGKGSIQVNKKDYKDYFPTHLLQYKLEQAQNSLSMLKKFDISINVFGGGLTGQAEAARLAIARALVKLDEENKSTLRKEGLITRDPRMVERKKPGQRKARKKTQFSKR